MHHDVDYLRHQDTLYSLNAALFHGTPVKVLSFMYAHIKRTGLPAPVFTKLANN